MLTLTDNAITVIRRLTSQVEDSKTSGLRIGVRPRDRNRLSVEVASAPELGDEVVENSGARVFLDGAASPSLANKELDVQIGEDSIQFSLRSRK